MLLLINLALKNTPLITFRLFSVSQRWLPVLEPGLKLSEVPHFLSPRDFSECDTDSLPKGTVVYTQPVEPYLTKVC